MISRRTLGKGAVGLALAGAAGTLTSPDAWAAPKASGALPDGTWVGRSEPAQDYTFFRLEVTVAGGLITDASFALWYTGFPWSIGFVDYAAVQMATPSRIAAFQALVPDLIRRSAAADTLEAQLVGRTSASGVPMIADADVHAGLLGAWNWLVTHQLRLIKYRGVVLGDNDGLPHDWNLYLPRSVQREPHQPVPLVLMLHGAGNTMEMAEGGGVPYVGATEGFISVLPDTSNGTAVAWNYRMVPTLQDDFAFLLALIDRVQSEHTIDTSRIYSLGISSGAVMSSVLTALYPERFAGVSAIAGTLAPQHLNDTVVAALDARLARGATQLAVVYGIGSDDYFFKATGPDASLATMARWWYPMNGIPEQPWDVAYPFGRPLVGATTYEHYGYDVHTGYLASALPPRTTLMRYYLVDEMFHTYPMPDVGTFSWAFLKQFRRLPNGKLVKQGR